MRIIGSPIAATPNKVSKYIVVIVEYNFWAITMAETTKKGIDSDLFKTGASNDYENQARHKRVPESR